MARPGPGVVAVVWMVAVLALGSPRMCWCRTVSETLSRALTSSFPDLSDFDIPDGVSIVANFVNEPQGVGPSDPRCIFMQKGRECMNVSSRTPIFASKLCMGKVCLMNVVPGPPSCLLRVATLKGDLTNSTRNLTCGLDPEDNLVSNPQKPVFGPPSSGSKTQLGGLPPGVQQKVFYPCLKGELHVVVRLTFPKAFADNYTCVGNPKCLKMGLSSQIVCYTTEEVRYSLVNGGPRGANKSLPLAFFLVALLFFAT